MARRILLLGPPGAGKGTQAALLANALHVPHISTGDMLRSAVAEGTDLGKRVESIMEAGELVSDDLVVAIVDERLSKEDGAYSSVAVSDNGERMLPAKMANAGTPANNAELRNTFSIFFNSPAISSN